MNRMILGIRYISRAGYDPIGMAGFLTSLEASSKLEAKEAGQSGNSAPSYLSTHPVTSERIAQSIAEAGKYTDGAKNTNRINYIKAISGMTVGDSAEQGFVADNKFIHPELGFMFDLPTGYKTENTAAAFIAQSKSSNGGTLLFTGGSKTAGQSVEDYLRQTVLKGDMSGARDFGTNTVNGFKTASVERTGTVNNVKSNIRTIVIEWDSNTVYQMTLAIPNGISQSELQALQQSAFSFRRVSSADKYKYRPKRIQMRVASSGDTVASMSARFPYNDGLNEERFRVINGLSAGEQVRTNGAYKVISQ